MVAPKNLREVQALRHQKERKAEKNPRLAQGGRERTGDHASACREKERSKNQTIEQDGPQKNWPSPAALLPPLLGVASCSVSPQAEALRPHPSMKTGCRLCYKWTGAGWRLQIGPLQGQ